MSTAEDLRIDIAPDLDAKAEAHPDNIEQAYALAEQLADTARSLAPVLSGEYAAGIVAQKTKTGARVYAGDYKSAWIEFGVPAHGIHGRFVLRRAADALGLSFRKSG